MIKVRDGYGKLIGSDYNGNIAHVLLSNGGNLQYAIGSTASTLVQRNASGQIESSVASTVAPFVISSTKVNTNLNADLLDGFQATGLFQSLTSAADKNLYIKIGDTEKEISPLYASYLGGVTKEGLFTELTNVNDSTNPNSIKVTIGDTTKYLKVAYSDLAGKVVCSSSTNDVDRPIVVTNTSNGVYYSTKVTLNYSTGNVTAPTFTGTLIGNADTASKLQNKVKIWGQDFDGSSDVAGDLLLGSSKILGKDSASIVNARDNHLVLGYGYSEKGWSTYVDGNSTYFRYGTTHLVGMFLDSSGKVGIGTISPSAKLHVIGVTQATNFISGDGVNDFSAGTVKLDTLNIPTSSGGTTFGPGSNGQVLKSNGTSVYWGDGGGYWANLPVQATADSGTKPTFAEATVTTQVTTPRVRSTGRLTLNAASTALDLKFANDDTKSVILNGTEFKPFDSANGNLDLGASDARWKGLYAGTGNFAGDVVSTISTGDAVKHAVTNTNGSVELLVHTNRGLYDRTNSKWIIYVPNGTSKVYVPTWANKGGSTTPVYFNASGEPVACTSYTSALDDRYVKKAGDTMTGSLNFTTGNVIITTASTSNYKALGVFYKGSASASGTYDAQIGWHNTGDTNGALTLLPYATTTFPWDGSVGLYITKTQLKYNNQAILHSGNSSVSGGGSTWGSSITVKINGTSKTLTIPANPNTDSKVSQSETTTSGYRPVILGYTSSSTAGSGMTTSVTNVVYASNKFYAQPSTGNLYATQFNGILNTTSNQYYTDSKYGIQMNNSDIIGANGIYFGDLVDGAGEGLHFYRSSTTWDTLTAANGILYFSPNRATATHTLIPVFSALSNSGNNISITIGGQHRTLTPAYATKAGDADTLDGYHRSNLFTSYETWMEVSGLNKSITVGGNANTYYPVVISVSSSKLDSTRISVWKNLGSTTPSYSGNHSNGTSSLWLIYEGRNWMWDGNGGFIKTWYKYQGYATLVAHAEQAGSGVGNLVLYLRGGGCQYNIACSNSFTATVYTASTNIGSSSYPVNVAPRTTIGNGGIIESRLGYGYVDSASTATLASTVTVNNSDANSTYRMVWHSGNNLYSTAGIYCNPSTDCLYASHYYETSDIAFKTNIKPILNSDNIPVLKSFDWKSDGSHSYGLIAQELEAMGYPELVCSSGSYKTVNYSAALSLIVGKLQVKIKELEKEIEILKNKN